MLEEYNSADCVPVHDQTQCAIDTCTRVKCGGKDQSIYTSTTKGHGSPVPSHLSIACPSRVRFRVAPSTVCWRMLTESASMHTLSMLCASSKTTMLSRSNSREMIPET